MKFQSLYFDWLQHNNPVGTLDRFPELKNKFETSEPGIYCIGDLTGIPLVKFAAESGYELIQRLAADEQFCRERKEKNDNTIYDCIIAGAGPSGISAGVRAHECGFKYLILESSHIFNTITNFPAGKAVYVTPKNSPVQSALRFSDGTKETLLDDLFNSIKDIPLQIHEKEMVNRIVKDDGFFTVETSRAHYKSLRMVVAIGKTGNARSLGVKGEKSPKVYTRLIDPGEFQNKDILVVGGGDSAVEAAIACAKSGNRVALSYRKSILSRPNDRNRRTFEDLVKNKSIIPLFQSQVKEIRETEVVMNTVDGEKTIPNHIVFSLIGTEIPVAFFNRCNIRMEKQKNFTDWIRITALLFFAVLLYMGKKAPATVITGLDEFIGVPALLMHKSATEMLTGIGAWISLCVLTVCGLYLVAHHIKKFFRKSRSAWNLFKSGYFGTLIVLFCWLYITEKLFGRHIVSAGMDDWYTAAYSLTIVIFGIRRIFVHPTGYVKRQTWTLITIQVVPLFIVPLFLLPWMAAHGLLSEWIKENVFPHDTYWRAYGFILAWPLFIHNLATGQPTSFWLLTGVLQTFVVIPWIVYKWGKGAYCGWICSCGALSETLGDEYRATAPHGQVAKRLENTGQFVLWFAAGVTIIAILAGSQGTVLSHVALNIYWFIVDIIFAGVLGLGVYFYLSGRVWCRFLCPLAALMHIYARFSAYRIFSDKKRCISCAICTKVCHMGIDVMNFANKGIPMDDVECVRCSACIISCPLQVLTFGTLNKSDPGNNFYMHKIFPLAKGWKSGLPQKDIAMLIEQQEHTVK